MRKKGFDFWQDHSLKYLEMAYRTDKKDRIEHPDGYGKRTGVCGDTVEMFIKVTANTIHAIAYDADGCLNTNACACTVAVLAEGKTLAEAWEIKPDNIIDFLETLPRESTHCAEWAVGAFYHALSSCQAHPR